MRIRQRRITAVIGLVMSFLAVSALTAQAAPSDSANSGSVKTASVAAAEPTTSPAAVRRYRIPAGASINCPSGYVCAVANYGVDGGWLFEFYNYGTYSLNNWYGQDGSLINTQTGDAGVRALDQNGKVVRCQWAGTGDSINWDPVWYISLSSTPC